MFTKPKFGKYYVAVEKNSQEIIGMMMIHNELSPLVGGLIHWINSVYVKKEWRKKGVFR